MVQFRHLLVFLIAIPQFALAATPDELERLYQALRGPDLMAILSEEGQMQSLELQAEMFPGRSNGAWRAKTAAIYNVDVMQEVFRDRFDKELTETDVSPLLAFLESDEGQRVVQLEVDARRALMDESVEEAAKEAFAVLEDNDPARLDQLEAFVDENDLIDLNVSGALNANLAFYSGLSAGGGFNLPQDEILADVWSSADGIRADTTEWVFSYLTMAYGPLSDAELQDYIDLSATPEGRSMNLALFAAFDELFRGISFDIGKAASRFTQGDDI